MPVLVLKTNIDSDQGVQAICPILNLHPAIKNWHIDREDIDNVLRIESLGNLTDEDIIQLLTQVNIISESLKN